MKPFNLHTFDFSQYSRDRTCLITRSGHIPVIMSVDMNKSLPIELYKLTVGEWLENVMDPQEASRKVYKTYRVMSDGKMKPRSTSLDDLFIKENTDLFID